MIYNFLSTLQILILCQFTLQNSKVQRISTNVLKAEEADEDKADCTHCGCNLNANHTDLKLYAQSKKHKKSLTCKAVTLTTSFIKLEINEAHNIEGYIDIFLLPLCNQCVDMLKQIFLIARQLLM